MSYVLILRGCLVWRRICSESSVVTPTRPLLSGVSLEPTIVGCVLTADCLLTCVSSNAQALQDKENLYIVTPFYSGGEIFDAVADRGRFAEREARPLFRQALEGLLHLKRRGVCHR